MAIKDLSIQGMSCGHCVAAVTRALEGVEGIGVEQVAVGSAKIDVASDEQLRAAIQAIEEEGYSAAAAGAS